MKKCILLILLVGLSKIGTYAQGYYYFQTNGELPLGYDMNKVNDSNSYRKILAAETNNKLSATQSFPFPFRYNGNYYANYKVSDNGYITFNTSSSISYQPDSIFSNQQNLKNCIFPFWYDFELKQLPYPNQDFNVKVYAYTFGKYPNRTHIIQFFGLSKSTDTLSAFITNANVFAFAIVLHEGDEGRFDLIYNFFGKNNIYGLAGCSDDSGNFTLIKNKPIPYQVAASSATLNTIVYQFHRGQQVAKKLYLKGNILESQYPINQPVIIKSRISNLGTDTVYNFYYSYLVNGKDSITDSVNLKKSNLSLLPKGENTLLISATTPWSNGPAGSLNIIKAVAHFNTDSLNLDTLINSSQSKALRILGVKPIARNILLEISTGGWCGYCTASHLIAEDMKEKLDHRLIPIMHHFGDPMTTTESNKINEAYANGYPYGIIDRTYFSGASTGWPNIINIQKLDSSNVKVKIINKSYDAVTRKISFSIHVKCFDYLYGNYRIGAIITEDKVRGNPSPSQWSQSNFNSKEHGANDSTSPLYYEHRYMDGYYHNFVVLDMPSGAWGSENSLPQYMKPGDEFTMDYSYILPPTTFVEYTIENNTKYCSTMDGPGQNEGMFKPIDISLAGFMAFYNDENQRERKIINAVTNKLLFDNTSISNIINNGTFSVYPNPAYNNLTIIQPFNTNSEYLLTILDASGKEISSQLLNGSNPEHTLDISSLESGLYIIKASYNGQQYFQKIMVNRF